MSSGALPVGGIPSHDEAGQRQMNHRTKHRKEVKRYHQRQLNKHLREEARARDVQLFLFESVEQKVDDAAETQQDIHEVAGGTASSALSALTPVLQPAVGVVPITADSRSQQLPLSRVAVQQIQPAPAPASNAVALAAASSGELASITLSGWDFEFLLRAPPPSTSAAPSSADGGGANSCTTDTMGVVAVGDASACRSLRVLEPFESPAVVRAGQVGRTALQAAASWDSQITAIGKSSSKLPPDPCATQDANSSSSANWERIGVLPIYSGVSSTIAKLLNNTQVQRVQGVEAIPMQAPLAPGTDINQPPRTYLTLDPVHNVHQHAPGFLRNERVALQEMLAKAVMEWKDLQQNALIVSSADTMRAIFEQVYVPERPLALRVRRIGPTLVIDSRASEPTGVREMRQEALFGKALYFMKETQGRDVSAASEPMNGAAAAAAGQLALTRPERRLASMTASDVHFGAHLHRYSRVLRWRMDTTEVLIGTDAPIVMDLRSNTEQLVRVKEKTPVGSADGEQREVLRSWFDAMMANVPQIGTYVHLDGVLQSHQVKKTVDVLGSAEARMAAAALSFTSSALQWLVKQCHRDGSTYAVVRDCSSDYVELFELPDLDESTAFVEETDKYFGCAAPPAFACVDRSSTERADDGGAYMEREVPSTTLSGYDIGRAPAAHPFGRFNRIFGKTCFNIGQHMYRSGDVKRAGDALPLLHRSLRILLPSCREDGAAREIVTELVNMVPVLIARKLQAAVAVSSTSAAAGAKTTAIDGVSGMCSSPELYRDALVLCGRFEIPLQHVFLEARESESNHVMQAFYAQCLVACSAAVCAVVALSLEAYYGGCQHLRALRTARSEAKAREAKKELRVSVHQEGAMMALSSCIQDILQVVIEGLVRLEEASELLGPMHSATAATAKPKQAQSGASGTQESDSMNGATPDLRDRGGLKEGPMATTSSLVSPNISSLESYYQSMPSRTSLAHTTPPSEFTEGTRGSDSGIVPASSSTLLNLHTQVNITPLRSALCELYGDVAVIAMSDAASGFSVRVLTELSMLMETRLQKRGHKLPTTLVWLTTLKADVVSLSFTAQRFYSRIGTQTRRHLVKLSLVYYLVGQEHHRTARYTKALEALHRAKSLLHASQKAADDAVFGAVFGSRDMLQTAEVMLLLGDVYRSVVERKLDCAHGVAAVTLQQPLLFGSLHDLPPDADDFFTQALSVYTQGGADKDCRVARAYTLLLYASVLMERFAVSGVAATHSASQRIAQLIREAEELAPNTFVQEREWQTLRLFTVTCAAAQDTALVRAVEEIMFRTTTTADAAENDSPGCHGAPAVAPAVAAAPAAAAAAAVDGNNDSAEASGSRTEVHAVDTDKSECRVYRRERLVMPPMSPVLVELQKALVCCEMVEREFPAPPNDTPPQSSSQSRPREPTKVVRTEAKYRSMLRWVGRTAGYLTSVLDYYKEHISEWQGSAMQHQWHSVLRSWGEHDTGTFIHRMVSMIALRLLRASQAQLAGTKQQKARDAIKQIACALHNAASVNSGEGVGHTEHLSQTLSSTRALLAPFLEW